MSTPNLISENIEKIADLFPGCIVEAEDELGNKVRKVDFDLLKAELWDQTWVEWLDERYRLDWPGKKRAILKANTPITKTLRPVKKDSVDWDTTQNLYIEGDNFEVLKILQESYLWKVKMIYIDPPYNTWNNLLYKNDYSEGVDEYNERTEENEEWYKMVRNLETNGRFHSDWLSMMYERLKIARDLLTDDWFIIIAIDDCEIANLEVIWWEVFWEANKLGIITVVHKPEWRNQEKFLATSTEYMLLFAKDKDKANFSSVIFDEESFWEAFKDDKWYYKLNNYLRWGWWDANLRINKPHFWYPVYINKSDLSISLDEKTGYTAIYPVTSTWVERTWKTKKETLQYQLDRWEIVAKKENWVLWIFEKYRWGQLVKTHWIAKKYNAINYWTRVLEDLFEWKVFDFPKSLYLVEDIIKVCTTKGDKILDFFSGSATTAHAVLDINAKESMDLSFVLAQIPESCDKDSEAYKNWYKTICEIWKERIRRAWKKIKEETWADIDYWFRVYRVDESCMKDVYYHPSETKQEDLWFFTSNIKENRTPEDLLTQVILNFGLTLDLPIEEKQIWNSKVFYVAWNSLLACFDDNILDETIEIIAKEQPIKLVFRDSCFKDDSQRINVENKVKRLSPETIIKVI